MLFEIKYHKLFKYNMKNNILLFLSHWVLLDIYEIA